jgi:hypothetical protein
MYECGRDQMVVQDMLESVINFFLSLLQAIKTGIITLGKKIAALIIALKKLLQKKIFTTLRNLNIYRRTREFFIYRYLSKTLSIQKEHITITWQPFLFILLKIIIAATASFLAFNLYPYLSSWLKEGLIFFRLHEIYNFDFPTGAFLDTVAQIIIVIILGYIGLFFITYQTQALFSSLVVSTDDKKVYYIKNIIVWKALYIFSIPEIDHVVLKQNILYRLIGVGTIVFQKKSGEKVIINSIKNAPKVFRELSLIKSGQCNPCETEGKTG